MPLNNLRYKSNLIHIGKCDNSQLFTLYKPAKRREFDRAGCIRSTWKHSKPMQCITQSENLNNLNNYERYPAGIYNIARVSHSRTYIVV